MEEKHEALSDVVYEIKDNHLVHLADDIKEIRKEVGKLGLKIAYWSGGIGVASAVVQYLLK